MQQDILGTALLDYQLNNSSKDIHTYSSLDETDILPVAYMFRNHNQMPTLEKKALELCKGNVLDVGCGAGSHSLYLQNKGYDVTGLDRSPGAIEVCNLRGIKNCHQDNFLDFKGTSYNTILMLMNGIGIAGTIAQLDKYLTKLKSLLSPDGQILVDSSDIIYMFEDDIDGGRWVPTTTTYYGEVTFTMEYKGKKSDSFQWLYIDFNTLQAIAIQQGFLCELVREGEHYDYLARLVLKK